MKKVLLLTLLLVVAVALVACGGSDATTTKATSDSTTPAVTTVSTTQGSTPVTTTAQAPVTTTPATTTAVAPATTTPATTTAQAPVTTTPATTTVLIPVTSTPDTVGVTTPVEDKLETTEDYTAVLNEFTWDNAAGGDTDYDFSGSSASVVGQISAKYNGYKKNYYMMENGERKDLSTSEVKKLPSVSVKVTGVTEEGNKACDILVVPFELKFETEWKSVTARAGSYLMFDFTTNLTSEFYVSVTSKPGDSKSTAAYVQDGISVDGANGKYTGVAKCTVPYAKGATMYINICTVGSGSNVMASIPVTITEMKYESPFKLVFQGDWELVKREDYLSDLVDLFYNVYPRLYQRFALNDPNVPETITFMADKNYDGVAYCAGPLVCVSTDYANSSPYDIGFFAHEITHSVQQYGGKLTYNQTNSWTDPESGKKINVNCWWTENMANLGRFRYFEWGYSTKFIVMLDVKKNSSLWDWGYSSYADGGKAFLSYLDWKYPSIDKNGDKKLDPSEYGVIDLINYTIKTSNKLISDHPFDPDTPFNQAVKTATGGKFATIEALRLQYVEDCKSGEFTINGFKYYVDNWVTEDIPGVPNPVYPQKEPVTKGDKTAAVLETPVTDGTNIALGAKPVEFSAESGKNLFANAFDGDLTTKWQASANKNDYKYTLGGYQHEFVIDLGEKKTFDTYTLVNAGVKENKTFNTKEWEIFVSDDGKTWTSVDYQKDNTKDIVSVNVGDTSAQFVKVRFFATDKSGVGTARLYEFMLFDQQ